MPLFATSWHRFFIYLKNLTTDKSLIFIIVKKKAGRFVGFSFFS